MLSNFVNCGPRVRYVEVPPEGRDNEVSEECDRRSTSITSDQQEQSVALGTGAIVKRRATEMETGEGGSDDGNAVVQVRKKRKDDFEDRVREAQKINNDEFTPLVATHEEWREVLKLAQERYRDEAARKRRHEEGDAAMEAVAARLEDDAAEKAVLAFCAVFGHSGTNRAWEYFRMVQRSRGIAESQAAQGIVSEALTPLEGKGTLLDQFVAAEEKTHTVKTQERSAQIMRLVQQIEFIKVYQRLVEDASKDDSATRREFDAMKMRTRKGLGWASVCTDWLLAKKHGVAIENGRLKHADKKDVKTMRKKLHNDIADCQWVYTYTSHLGLGAVVFTAGLTKEEALFKRLPSGLLSIVAQTVAEVIPVCREMADRVFEEILGPDIAKRPSRQLGIGDVGSQHLRTWRQVLDDTPLLGKTT
ncbi:MAG: hypothetical protein Q9171_004803 [Xanthocarpia ochracea]